MRRVDYFIILSIFTPCSILAQQDYFGQQIVPKLPEAEKYELYGKFSLNNSKGAPNISIPIHIISVDGVTVPVTLNYISTGIRVNDVPTAAGLNWFINAGGYISRNINGLADDEDLGWFNVPEEYRPESGWWNQADCDPWQLRFRAVANYQWDAVPDMFSYNFLDRNGTFFFGRDKSCYTGLKNGLRIEFWDKKCITDEFGNQYFFGTDPKSQEINGVSVFQEGDTEGTEGRNASGTTGWRLTKIITRNGREIEFEYETYNYHYFFQSGDNYNWRKYLCNNMECINTISARMYVSCNAYASLLKSISVDNEVKVGFFYSDIDPSLKVWQKKLTKIHIRENPNDKNPRIFTFLYDTYSDSRLRLIGLMEQDSIGSVRGKKYSFGYNGSNIGAFGSKSTDRFGYYNGSTGETDIPNQIIWPDNPATRTTAFRDRNINDYLITNGILNEIIYPTGGKTKFYYESNKDGDFYSPGVRVYKIENIDGHGTTGVRKYTFIGLNGYKRQEGDFENHARSLPHYYTMGESGDLFLITPWHFLNSDEYHCYPGDNHDFCYSYVSIEDLDNKGVPKIRMDEYFKPYMVGNSMTGYLKTRKYFKEDLINLVKQEEYEYNYECKDKIYGFLSEDSYFRLNEWMCNGESMKQLFGPEYYFPNLDTLPFRSHVVTSSFLSESEFSMNGDIIRKISNYAYNTNYQLSERKDFISGSADTVTTLYKYADDYNVPELGLLEVKNVTGIPLDVRILNRDGKIKGGYISEPDANGNIIKVYGFESAVPVENNWSDNTLVSDYFNPDTYMFYDAMGNIKEVKKVNNISVSFIWGYNHSFPVIKAENADNSLLTSIVTQSLPDGYDSIEDLLKSAHYFPETDWKAFNLSLRQKAGPDVMISTFTYNTLSGITSHTGPKGMTTWYEYDGSGHLQCIRDDDYRIIRTFEYNYRH